jgi:flagellar hook protein FlgE
MNSFELSVVGDNIANANTIGFKSGRAAFHDALLQELIGAPGGGQLGLGVRLEAIQRIITQGALTATGLATDLALEGSGYFVLRGNHNGINAQFYTRAGQFTVDKTGYLVNLEGLRVQGYQADPRGAVQATLGDLQIGTASSAPVPSTAITVKANLNSDAVTPAAFDPLNPSATSNFSSSVTIYDTLGKAHTVDVYYRKSAAGAWDFHAMTDGAGVVGGTPGVASEIASGDLAFDAQGRLTTVTQASAFNPIGATGPQPLTFDFGDDIASGGTGLGGITQFASPSATTFTAQDGSGYGSLSSIQINNKGEVTGAFTNGTTKVLGQVAVGDFSADDKLTKIGGNLLLESTDSGQPTIGAPGEGGRAPVNSGALEQSNVDLANEFVRMIAAQRGFQANSKTISTADQLLQELMTLKR